MLGKNILKLRKQAGLSQEELGEKINVTRQTISNWELNETAPNPEQLKLLSKVLDVSIDDLLNNERKEVLANKISNTEKLAGIIIKILKIFGIIFIIYFIFIIIGLISLILFRTKNNQEESISFSCSLNAEEYKISIGSANYFSCPTCSNELQVKLKELTNYQNISASKNNIENYFTSLNGYCE